MDECYDSSIPTKIVNDRNTRWFIFLVLLWFVGFIFPFIARPTSYVRMCKMERKIYPVHKKYRLDNHLNSSQIYSYLKDYTNFYKHKIEMYNLSLPTYEGRDINVVHMKLPSYYGNVIKGRILVLAGMSGCIWDSVMTTIDLIHKLCEECSYKYPYSMDYEWYIIPIFNPDGYDYTLSIRNTEDIQIVNDQRNRSPRPGCYGTALDRNFGFHWGESKSRDYSSHDCWMGFAGTFPFSENETIAMNDFIKTQYELKKPITMYLQIHGNNERDDITYPWRYTKRKPSNYRTLDSMAETAAKFVSNEMGYHFTHSQSSHRDRASGVMSDWLMGTRNIAYLFTIEPWYKIENESNIPEPRIYLEKAIGVVFSLVKSLRTLQITRKETELFN